MMPTRLIVTGSGEGEGDACARCRRRPSARRSRARRPACWCRRRSTGSPVTSLLGGAAAGTVTLAMPASGDRLRRGLLGGSALRSDGSLRRARPRAAPPRRPAPRRRRGAARPWPSVPSTAVLGARRLDTSQAPPRRRATRRSPTISQAIQPGSGRALGRARADRPGGAHGGGRRRRRARPGGRGRGTTDGRRSAVSVARTIVGPCLTSSCRTGVMVGESAQRSPPAP